MTLQNPLRAAQSFIFGGQTGLTYEQMKAAREFAARQQQALSRTPTNVGEGWGAILRGLAAGRAGRSAEAAATEGRERVQSALGTLLQGRLGGGSAPTGAASFLPPQAASGGYGITPDAAPGAAAFPASLIQSESGGDWGALNNEGYGGRLQFGADRLADAARAGMIPAGVTGAEFSKMPPEVQQRVEQWHFADIDSQAQRMGLDRYVGQTVAGIPITQDGIRAMAHLGGIGGAAKFLQSGGRHNPADSNGTSLADYARKHGGGRQAMALAEGQQPDLSFVSQMGGGGIDPQLLAVMADPYVSELPQMQQGALAALFERQLAQAYPEQMTPYQQAQIELAQQELALKTKPGAEMQPLMNAGGGQIYNPNTDEWITAPGGSQQELPAAAQALQWRAEQAGLKPGTPEYAQFMIEGGSNSGLAIDVDPSTGAVSVRQGGGAGASAKPFTEAQSKDIGFVTRMRDAESNLAPVENALTSMGDRSLDADPTGLLRGSLQSKDYQLAKQAGSVWLLAFLRKDSGAATTKEEDALYGATFLPQPGDGPAVIEQKRKSRERAMKAVEAGMSPLQIVAQERALMDAPAPPPTNGGDTTDDAEFLRSLGLE